MLFFYILIFSNWFMYSYTASTRTSKESEISENVYEDGDLEHNEETRTKSSSGTVYKPLITVLRDRIYQYRNNAKQKNNESDENYEEENSSNGSHKPKNSILSFETFNKYYPYLKHTFKIATFFIPGLGAYQQIMFGLDMINIGWKTVDMYNKGESWTSIFFEFVPFLGRRSETDSLLSLNSKTAAIDFSSIDTETLIILATNDQYPLLEPDDETLIETLIGESIDKYLTPNGEHFDRRDEFIQLMKQIVKCFAFHGLIPTILF